MGSGVSKKITPIEQNDDIKIKRAPYNHSLRGGKPRPCITCHHEAYFKYTVSYNNQIQRGIVCGEWVYNCDCYYN
tara:strand:- start:2905 stop:3129 length:225 start_codon:yes stop_codon:yes gene_type:complete